MLKRFPMQRLGGRLGAMHGRMMRTTLCISQRHASNYFAALALQTNLKQWEKLEKKKQRQKQMSAASDGASSSASSQSVALSTPEEVEEAFRCSVQARTVSNAQLRLYIKGLPPKDHGLALAAVKGAKAAGLAPNVQTYEVLIIKLLEAGQLRAAMELYRHVLDQHMTPTPHTYAALMSMCLQREMPAACQSLYTEMIRRGAKPQPENHELMITALAAEVPPQWERAVDIFEKLCSDKGRHLSANAYNALMRVYMNMTPFDWRVVYNCYHELRTREPRIPLKWESYLIVREALRRGEAGYVRRFLTYIDAWCAVTSIRSWDFLVGLALYFVIMFVLKSVMSVGALKFLGITEYAKNRNQNSTM